VPAKAHNSQSLYQFGRVVGTLSNGLREEHAGKSIDVTLSGAQPQSFARDACHYGNPIRGEALRQLHDGAHAGHKMVQSNRQRQFAEMRPR